MKTVSGHVAGSVARAGAAGSRKLTSVAITSVALMSFFIGGLLSWLMSTYFGIRSSAARIRVHISCAASFTAATMACGPRGCRALRGTGQCAIACGRRAIVHMARLRQAILDLRPVAQDVVADPGERARLRELRQVEGQAHPPLPDEVLGSDLDDQLAALVAGDRGVVRRDVRPSDDQVVVGRAADPQPAAAKRNRLLNVVWMGDEDASRPHSDFLVRCQRRYPSDTGTTPRGCSSDGVFPVCAAVAADWSITAHARRVDKITQSYT